MVSFIKPSAAANMKQYLMPSYGEIMKHALTCKAIGAEVCSSVWCEFVLVKVNMNQLGVILYLNMYVCKFEPIQHVFRQKAFCKESILFHSYTLFYSLQRGQGIFIAINYTHVFSGDPFIRIIKSKHRAPYLFLGSGFTKHYLPTPTWEELLSQFTSRHMNEIYTKMGRDLPKVASFIAEEVNNTFWKRINDDPQCVEKQYVDRISQSSDYLKIKIAEKLKEIVISYRTNDEINYLSKLHIDGIITTNWDDFAEVVFPKFKKYVGQSELLFSSTTNIGEIFKIHGCIHQPNTMVLTKEDYENFTQRNAYLAAKLITIFLEHPIFFIGYSLEDPNIQEILESIVDCFKGNESLSSKLQNNLIFVEWVPEHIADIRIERLSKMMRNGVMLPCIKIIAHDFMPIYECMSYFERGIPTHLLRVYKEQFYDIIYDEQPEKQIYVLPESKVDGNNSVDFVCGFGAISKYKEIGYSSIDRQMIFRDIIDEQNYDAYRILKKSFPSVRNGNVNYLPYYKYLNSLGT